jgi:hypothetical protein
MPTWAMSVSERVGRMSTAAGAHTEMIAVSDAVKRLGLSRPTLRRKIAVYGLPTYKSPLDGRRTYAPTAGVRY